MESLKIYVERVEKPKNFMLNDESEEAKRRILVQKQIMEAQAFIAKRKAREEIVERKIRE